MLTDEDKQWITNAITAAKSETIEALRDVETKLLTEFHKWASPIDARLRTHMAMLRAIDLEMESHADRITKLEPPKAPEA